MHAGTGGQVITFGKDTPGEPPARWRCGRTGSGLERWEVALDDGVPGGRVLMQSGASTFAWCVKDGAPLADGYVEVKFKPVGGREDQAGGVVWRWKDADNYYVARANALEDNVSLYYTQGGRRTTIRYVEAPVPGGQWHRLRAEFAGGTIRVWFDGKLAIEETDTHIAGPGLTGVWTKADSVTAFDDFSSGPLAP